MASDILVYYFTKGERNYGEVYGWPAPLGPNRPIGGVKTRADEPVALGSQQRAMQSFEYPSVGYWSKEINGTLTGGQKN